MNTQPTPKALCRCAMKLTAGLLVGVTTSLLLAWERTEEPPTPETLIVASSTDAATASFRFASDQAGVRYETRLDGGVWTTARSILELDEQAEGEHRLEVRSRNAAGLTDPTPMLKTWTTAAR